MRVLITRPIEDAEVTAKDLHARGHAALVSPLLAVNMQGGPALDLSGVQAILATSANGIRALAPRTVNRDILVFAVGPQTADEATKAGFKNVRAGTRDIVVLAEAVSHWTSPDKGTLLHASGNDGAGKLAGLLTDKGFDVRTETLYSVNALPLSQEAIAAINSGEVDAVMLYSPRSARLFRDAITEANLAGAAAKITAICISSAAANALALVAFADIRVASAPNQDALLACLD